jgi:hypothetical protein
VRQIKSDTSLVLDQTATLVGAGAALTAGVRATSVDASRPVLNYAVFLTSTGLLVSTQRTTLYNALATKTRRIGWISTDQGGSILGFYQVGGGATRKIMFSDGYGSGDSGILNGVAGTGANVDQFVARAAPTATAVALELAIVNPVAANKFITTWARDATNYNGAFQVGDSGLAIGAVVQGVCGDVPCDSAQYVTWAALADANNPYYMFILGYTDEI